MDLGREAQGILGDVSGRFSRHPRPSLPVPSSGWASASPAWLCQAAAKPELFPKIEIKNAFIDFFNDFLQAAMEQACYKQCVFHETLKSQKKKKKIVQK